jgi:hypothetical protein
MKQKNYEQAINEFNKYIQIDSKYARVYLDKGKA